MNNTQGKSKGSKKAGITRRSFICNLGVISLIPLDGGIFTRQLFNSQELPGIFQPVKDSFEWNCLDREGLRSCLFVGTGSFGDTLASSLATRSKYYSYYVGRDDLPYNNCSGLDIVAHSSDKINELKNAEVIFLAGSLGDESFLQTREALLSPNIGLIFTLGLIPENSKTECLNIQPEKNECLIPLRPEASAMETELLIRDLYYAIFAPQNLMGADFADKKTLCAGRIAVSSFIEADPSQVDGYIDRFLRFVKMKESDLLTASGIYPIFLYNEMNRKLCDPFRFEDLREIETYMLEHGNSDARILSDKKRVRNIDADVRLRLMMTYQPDIYNSLHYT